MAQEAVVTFDYDKQQEDELSLRVGDVIKDVMEVDEGWCEGSLNGKKGMFPSNFVKMRPATETVVAPASSTVRDSEPPVLRGTTAKKKVRRAKVTFSYAADNDDELTLAPGKVVEVIAEEEEGWWRGVLDGHEGVFPSNFVEEILEAEEVKPVKPPSPEPIEPTPPPVNTTPASVTPAAKQPNILGAKMFPGGASFNPAAARANLKRSTAALPPAEPKKSPEMMKKPPPPVTSPTKPPELPDKKVPEKKAEQYKVTFAYQADVEDELTINIGDVVEIVNKDVGQEGWWEVRLNGKTGLIPNNFVELIVSAPPPKQPQPTHTPKPPPPAVHQKEPPAIPGKPAKKPPPAVPTKAEPPPPAHDTTDATGTDFGVPTTTPLDSSAVKNRPKKTARPPSRSNLLMEESNNVEPPKPEPTHVPEKPPEKTEPASHIAPWQKELKTRKAKPPAPKPIKKAPAPKPAPPTPSSHKPEIEKPKPPAAVSKPPAAHVETKPLPSKETPPPSSTLPPTSIPRSQSHSRSITPTLPPSESTPSPSDGAWKAEFDKLREEFEAFKKVVLREIEVLTDDLDKERKFRAALEVDIDRLKKAARPTAALR